MSAIFLPLSEALINFALQPLSFLTIPSACARSSAFPVDDIAVSVDVTTLPTTEAIELRSVVMAVMPPSDRMAETRDWIVCTRSAV
jgi:hypothetical protein